MTKRKENEPDNKAMERLREFNKQREAIPSENKEEEPSSQKKDQNPPDSDEDKSKVELKQSTKNDIL